MVPELIEHHFSLATLADCLRAGMYFSLEPLSGKNAAVQFCCPACHGLTSRYKAGVYATAIDYESGFDAAYEGPIQYYKHLNPPKPWLVPMDGEAQILAGTHACGNHHAMIEAYFLLNAPDVVRQTGFSFTRDTEDAVKDSDSTELFVVSICDDTTKTAVGVMTLVRNAFFTPGDDSIHLARSPYPGFRSDLCEFHLDSLSSSIPIDNTPLIDVVSGHLMDEKQQLEWINAEEIVVHLRKAAFCLQI